MQHHPDVPQPVMTWSLVSSGTWVASSFALQSCTGPRINAAAHRSAPDPDPRRAMNCSLGGWEAGSQHASASQEINRASANQLPQRPQDIVAGAECDTAKCDTEEATERGRETAPAAAEEGK